MPQLAAAKTLKIVALGDSLTAGYMLPADAAFPAVLEKALRADKFDVDIVNAGVSGDTAADGQARLDWSLGDGADGVILELGANDMLRGADPATVKTTLDSIMAILKARKLPVLIAGMKANPSLGDSYVTTFDAIYPALADKYGAPLYPFFLDGVAGDANLELADGMHPNRAGVEIVVHRILPAAEAFLRGLSAPDAAQR